ncbi:hypothetical protein OfM1_19700 [Lactovum odontotermitis]
MKVEELQNYLTDNVFYYCKYLSFQKFGIFTFEADGKIGGSHGLFEQQYKVFEERLILYNNAMKEVAEFLFDCEDGRTIVGKS